MAESEGKQIRYTFSKKERLSSKILIRELFTKGSSFYLYPFKVVYLPLTDNSVTSVTHQVLFTVPKRRFKKAVVRNFIRRRMREAYRLNKSDLYLHFPATPLLLAFIYTGKENPSFEEINTKLKASLKRLKEVSSV
jgi:ribonuclease P protein component